MRYFLDVDTLYRNINIKSVFDELLYSFNFGDQLLQKIFEWYSKINQTALCGKKVSKGMI